MCPRRSRASFGDIPKEREIAYAIAICGMLLSLPLLLFSWIGAQTFIRQKEKAVAILLFWFCACLLVLSLLTFLHPDLAIYDAIGAGAAALIYLTMWISTKLRKPEA